MISPSDLAVVVVAVAIVAAFFFVTRHFIRQSERDVAREDAPESVDATDHRHRAH